MREIPKHLEHLFETIVDPIRKDIYDATISALDVGRIVSLEGEGVREAVIGGLIRGCGDAISFVIANAKDVIDMDRLHEECRERAKALVREMFELYVKHKALWESEQ